MSKNVDRNSDGLRTGRTTLKRQPNRGSHDFETIARILDEALFCHIGFLVEGQPYVVPASHGRDGRALYIHGSAAGRMMKALSAGAPLCLTVTLLDGLVFGRSATNHSANYRSAVILGVAREVSGDEKLRGLEVITEHVARGRWADVRPPTEKELKATTVLKLDVEEASAKVRQGPPIDDEEDYALECWAGELPFALLPQAAVPDGRLLPGVKLPKYLAEYRRPQDATTAGRQSGGHHETAP